MVKESNTSMRLKKIMGEQSLKQVDILEKSKPYCDQHNIKLTKSDLSQFVNGKVEPGSSKLGILALSLGVSETWLMGYDVPMERERCKSSAQILTLDDVSPMPSTRAIPLIGTIASGTTVLAEENIDEMVQVPCHIRADFAVQCKDNSMINARILDGDTVYIRIQPMVENGQIAAVILGGETTLKRVYVDKNSMILEADGNGFPPLSIANDQLGEVQIIGKAVYFVSAIR